MKAVCEEAWRLVGHRAADVCCGTKGGTHPLSPAVHLMFVTAHFELPSAADCRPPASVCGLCGGVCCVWWRLLCGGGVGGGCVACAFICLDPGRQFDVGWHHTHTRLAVVWHASSRVGARVISVILLPVCAVAGSECVGGTQ